MALLALEPDTQVSCVEAPDDPSPSADEAIRLDRVRQRLHAMLSPSPVALQLPVAGEFEC